MRIAKVDEASRPIYNADDNCRPNLIFMNQSDFRSEGDTELLTPSGTDADSLVPLYTTNPARYLLEQV